MSLLGEIQAAQADAAVQRCPVRRILTALSDEDRADLETALGTDQVAASAISKVLQTRGFSIGDEAVRRHRRGVCRCKR